ncbi:MAG: hypothetical protein ACYTHK_12835 [Planctomycetota bacterium]|jgi:hypothetical protein
MGKRLGAALAVAAALLAGLAAGQEKGSVEERLKKVRREVKIIDHHKSIPEVAPMVEREKKYEALLDQMDDAARNQPTRMTKLLTEARQLKLEALKDLNRILKLHRGKHVGLTEAQIFERLKTRFINVQYEDEWLVNILDDLEEACRINIEMDARVYKFDSVTFDFESTSARAMLQMMADELLYKWIVRGDTLYVYKERNEVLFGQKWLRNKKRAERARRKAMKEAQK